MRSPHLLYVLLPFIRLSSASVHLPDRTTTISLQQLTPNSPIVPLCEITYNPSTLVSSLQSYTPPDLDTSPSSSSSSSFFPISSLVRIGPFSAAEKSFQSSTSLTSTDTFSKGYKPVVIVSLDAHGDVLSVSVKSERIDAGQTRDFGPSVVVRAMGVGKKPDLNSPIVLSKEGKLVNDEVVEKTFLQKYWWLLLGVMMLMITSGGGGE